MIKSNEVHTEFSGRNSVAYIPSLFMFPMIKQVHGCLLRRPVSIPELTYECSPAAGDNMDELCKPHGSEVLTAAVVDYHFSHCKNRI